MPASIFMMSMVMESWLNESTEQFNLQEDPHLQPHGTLASQTHPLSGTQRSTVRDRSPAKSNDMFKTEKVDRTFGEPKVHPHRQAPSANAHQSQTCTDKQTEKPRQYPEHQESRAKTSNLLVIGVSIPKASRLCTFSGASTPISSVPRPLLGSLWLYSSRASHPPIVNPQAMAQPCLHRACDRLLNVNATTCDFCGVQDVRAWSSKRDFVLPSSATRVRG
jgi:hypothetical protein